MTTIRKSYTPAFKAQLVQELLKEEQTLTQAASKKEFIRTSYAGGKMLPLQPCPLSSKMKSGFKNGWLFWKPTMSSKKKNFTLKLVA